MKRFLTAAIAVIMLISGAAAQNNRSYSDTNGASPSGVSTDGDYNMWFLSAVKNNRTDIVSKLFQKEPWKAQSNIDVYQDADRKASISIFCVGVDMGSLDVVKQFIAAGYGKNDMCKIQLFTDEYIAVSKVDKTIKGTYEPTVAVGGGLGLFGTRVVTVPNELDLYTSTTESKTEKVVKTYFVNPLDFANGEMFDYLWGKGFRSENLLDMKILGEAIKEEKQNVIDYIVANIGKIKNKPAKLSDEKLKELIATAKNNNKSMAYLYLTGKILDFDMELDGGRAAKLRKSLDNLSLAFETLETKGIKNKTDTLGYGAINTSLKELIAIDRKAGEDAARKREVERLVKINKEDINEKYRRNSRLHLPKDILPYIDETSKIWMTMGDSNVNVLISLKNNTSWIYFNMRWSLPANPDISSFIVIDSLDQRVYCRSSSGFTFKTVRECLNLRRGNLLLPK